MFLRSRADLTFDEPLPELFKQGLAKTRWPGRCQTVQDPARPRTIWFFDGAHTHESLECAITWFVAPDTGLREKYGPNLSVEITRLKVDGTTGREIKEF